MYWLYLASVVAIVAFIFVLIEARAERMPISEKIWCAVLAMAFTFAPIFLIGNAASMIFVDAERKLDYSVDIRALSDGQRSEGSFFLGSGSIESDPVYFYYAEVGPKEYRQYWALSRYSTIVEDDSQTPRIEFWEEVSSNNNWTLFHGGSSSREYRFIVPNGTVVPNYVLDTSAR